MCEGILILVINNACIHIQLFSTKLKAFMRETIGHVMDERMKSKEVRNDLIDTLIELREEDKDKTFTVENQGEQLPPFNTFKNVALY